MGGGFGFGCGAVNPIVGAVFRLWPCCADQAFAWRSSFYTFMLPPSSKDFVFQVLWHKLSVAEHSNTWTGDSRCRFSEVMETFQYAGNECQLHSIIVSSPITNTWCSVTPQGTDHTCTTSPLASSFVQLMGIIWKW